MVAGPHETLLSQYKKCGQLNNQRLRNARNLEELVGIKVQSVDGALGVAGERQGSSTALGTMAPSHYDPKFDPLHFRQKVPCMADRSFLINQAILGSSTPSQRLNLGGGRAGRGASSWTTEGTMATGLGFRGPAGGSAMFSSGASTTTHQQQVAGGTRQPVSQGDAPPPDLNAQRLGSDLAQDSMNAGESFHNPEVLSQALPTDNIDAKEDPISALKSIFKPPRKRRRGPLEINPVMNKYRNKAGYGSTQGIRHARSGASGSGDFGQGLHPLQHYAGGKLFKEDMHQVIGIEQSNLDLSGEHGLVQQRRSQGGTHGEAQLESTFIRQSAEGAPRTESSARELLPESRELGSQGQEPMPFGDARRLPRSTRNLNVRERLENLRKLFAEEDMQDAVKDIQHDWELEDQKIMAEKQRFVASEANSTQAYSQANGNPIMPEDLDLPVTDLRRYLTGKIRNIAERSDPNNLQDELLPGHRKGLSEEFPGEARPRIQFKASTLTHIAELKSIGQENIENQFIERLFREQTDYHYGRYTYNQ